MITFASTRRIRLAGFLIALSFALVAPVSAFAAASWTTVASLATARADHTATLLASGKVLVAGGSACNGSNGSACLNTTSAELYDPATDTWSAAGNLITGRSGHTATLLTSGKVLIAGGNTSNNETATAELYDPASNSWTAAGSLHVAREYHTATLLPSGKVLVAGGGGACSDGHCGGENGVYPIAEPTSELYDPATDTWTVAASLLMPRSNAAATLLASGQVLIAGGIGCDGTIANGCGAADGEIYDPAANTWTATGAYFNAAYLAATRLTSGDVVVSGGVIGGIGYQSNYVGSAVYSAASTAWKAVGNLNSARSHHTSSPLPTGQVLAVGGLSDSGYLASSELYDPVAQVWYTLASLNLQTARSNHAATVLPSGKVLVTGGRGTGFTLIASSELYDPAANTFTVSASGGANGSIAAASQIVMAGLPASFSVAPNAGYHATLVGDTCRVTQTSGKLWTSSPINANCVVTATFAANAGVGLWSSTGSMATSRIGHTATALASGKVLVASAGSNFSGYSQTSAELFDPVANTWSAAGNLATARFGDTATLLPSGKVLVAGGSTGLYSYLTSAELYDPASNTWSAAASMSNGRLYHTATLLASGKVLVAGGGTNMAELYDPASNTWTAAGSLSVVRTNHTATLLASGKVLVAAGQNGNLLSSAELYDPATNVWTATGNLAAARSSHTATLLASGKVLVVAGHGTCNGNGGCLYLASAETFDPASNSWSPAGGLITARYGHSANLLPSGQVLIAGGSTGGSSNCDNYGDDCEVLASAELYDPSGNSFSATASMITGRNGHTATVLPSGEILAVGGLASSDNTSVLASAEIYGPASNAFDVTATAGANGTITPTQATMHLGSHVLFTVTPAGGDHATVSGDACSVAQTGGTAWQSSAIQANCAVTASFAANSFAGSWTATGSLANPRELQTATLLTSGKVLVAGGANGSSSLTSVELFDPATGTWSAAANLTVARAIHTATRLPSGKVLVAGGGPTNAPLASAEIYDPATNTWSTAGSLSSARTLHAAVLLASGKVLVVGGIGTGGILTSAEVYDPASNTWSSAGTLTGARWQHSLTLLPSGDVLAAAGRNDVPSQQTFVPPSVIATAEIYDPASNRWTVASSLGSARTQHTATLLPSGRVLVVAGGGSTGNTLNSAEQYDPASNSWSAAGGLNEARSAHTATLSPSGQLLVAGGVGPAGYLASAELYDPASNSWSATLGMIGNRASHTATLLASGQVLATGGYGNVGGNYTTTAGAELYGAANNNVFAIGTVASPAAGGSVICTPNPVSAGATASCSASAAAGYALGTISGCGGNAGSTNPYTTGAISAACAVTATFTGGAGAGTVSITTLASPVAGGVVRCTPNPVASGSSASCTATASTGYALTSISGCGGTGSATSPYTTGTVSAACTVTAVFSAISTGGTVPIATVANPAAGGSVVCTPNPVTSGSSASCSATPASGFSLGTISGCGGNSSSRSPYTTGVVTAACTVTASFSATSASTFPITTLATPAAGGSVTCTPNPVSAGGIASCTASSASGYSLGTISGCGGVASARMPYSTGSITSACTITASFVASGATTWTVNASVNGRGGTLTPATQTIADGATASVALTPDAGFVIANVTGCGGLLSGATYTTAAIRADCSITASFTAGTSTRVSLTSSHNPSTANQAVTFVATVTQPNLTGRILPDIQPAAAAPNVVPSGTVAFADNGRPLATVALDGNGVASYTNAGFSVGSHAISATFSGGGSAGTISQQVLPAQTTGEVAAIPAPALAPGIPILLSLLVSGLALFRLRARVAP